MDIRENNDYRLYFRKVPYPFWIMGSLFWLGALFAIYMIYEDLGFIQDFK
jgi:hypothetical protein